jgi:hypothetical protein
MAKVRSVSANTSDPGFRSAGHADGQVARFMKLRDQSPGRKFGRFAVTVDPHVWTLRWLVGYL